MIIFIGKSCLQIIRSSDYKPNNAFIFIMLWFVFPFLFILLKKKLTFIFIHFVIFNNNFCFNFTVLPSYIYIYNTNHANHILYILKKLKKNKCWNFLKISFSITWFLSLNFSKKYEIKNGCKVKAFFYYLKVLSLISLNMPTLFLH